jgi:hypothetical protein
MLLVHPAGLQGCAGRGAAEAGRRDRLAGVHDSGGERRLPFGAGEGATEAVAEAKQESKISIDLIPARADEWVRSGSVVTC